MTDPFDAHSTEKFRAAIARFAGLSFDESRGGFLGELLQRRLDQTGLPGAAYLDRWQSPPDRQQELHDLASDLTVGETYFFRNIEQFRALTEVVLPELLAARAASRALSLLSAGCASGEEAYSLAMLIAGASLDPRWRVSILGVDLNPTALAKALAGRYSSWSLRETPSETEQLWFRPRGRDLVVDGAIRDAVRFEERNLLDEDPLLWRPEAYDVIFCRNVLMYFTPEATRRFLARLTRSLAPGGYLFLGHAETLRGLSHDYHLRHTHGTFYYQRKDALDDGARDPVRWARRPGAGLETDRRSTPAAPPATAAADWSGTWIENIRRASERIASLTGGAPDPAARPAARANGGPRPDLSSVLELLQKERFAEALASWRQLPSESASNPDALLLRAALLTHSGQLEAADVACRELLALDELNAGAHYLLALCREGAGDRAGAVEHDQVAVYLDPAFAMPRLHMGLLARRAGDREGARRELGTALPLLQREDASRLLLFGGGFNRETLASLCRAELMAAGGNL